MQLAHRLLEKFRRFPFWSQVSITLGSAVILVVIWSACGSPPPPPPLDRAFYDYPAQRKTASALACSPDGKSLAIGGDDQTVQIRNFSGPGIISTWTGHHGAVTAVAFRSDGEIAASASIDKTVKLWDVSSGKELRTLMGHAAAVSGLAFSPDGSTLVTASEDKTLKLWEVSSGRELRTLAGRAGAIAAVAFSPDGKTIASGGSDKSLRLWDASTGELVRILTGPKTRVSAVAFTPDGKLVVAGTSKNVGKSAATLFLLRSAKLFAWDPQTGQNVFESELFSNSLTVLAFRPDGKELALSYVDSYRIANIGFFNMPGFTQWRRILAHHGVVRALAYSPDGAWLVSTGTDKRVRVWGEH